MKFLLKIAFSRLLLLLVVAMVLSGCSDGTPPTPTPTTDANIVPDSDTNANAISNTDTSANADAHTDANTDANADAHTDPDTGANADADIDPDSNIIIGHLTVTDVFDNPSAHDGNIVELSGQTFLTSSGAGFLTDGKSGVNLAGDTAALQKGFYRLKGMYASNSNTLNVTESIKKEVEYREIQAAKDLDINLVPVLVQGLIATTPKEVADVLNSYLSLRNFPEGVTIYPYVVYARDGFYLALSDTVVHLPAEVTFLIEGEDYDFTFSSGEVKGTLVKTPLEEISFGSDWQPDEFGGVIIADSILALAPESATVREISSDPASFAFRRVRIAGSYWVATATVEYSEVEVPFGVGILADRPDELFFEEQGPRLKTIDPERSTWQLRQTEVIGTVLYPTEEVLKYLDYSAPLSGDKVRARVKPALLVDTLSNEVAKVAKIGELNPVTGNPSLYWGEVVEFDGYALGDNISFKDVVGAIAQIEIPIDVNMLKIGIADSPIAGSQLLVMGLNNKSLDQVVEPIEGWFKFRVAVTEMPVRLFGSDTAFFLLSKEELESIVVSPTDASITKGGTQQFTARGAYSDGSAQNFTDMVMWTSSNMVVATIAPGGLATGLTVGTTTITSSLGPLQGSVSLEVTPAPAVLCHLRLSTTPSGHGKIAPNRHPLASSWEGDFECGTAVLIQAGPNPFFLFVHWSGDDSGATPCLPLPPAPPFPIGRCITITMDSDRSITAHFN